MYRELFCTMPGLQFSCAELFARSLRLQALH